MELPIWLRVLESLAAIITPILIAVGGFFAWYKFIRQGEHDPRLQPTVTGSATIEEGVAYIVATATAQNTGQIDVELDLEACALQVFTVSLETDWQTRYVSNVFQKHGQVQPGGTVEDQVLVVMTLQDEIAVRLDLTVGAAREFTWDTVEIVSLARGEGGN